MSTPHPDRDDDVRRLLGDVGADRTGEQLPDTVAERLDATLADLVAERTAQRSVVGDPGVVDLAAHRRRRLAAALFVAAACVVAAGVGVPLVKNHNTSVTDAGERGTATTAQLEATKAAVPSDGSMAAAESRSGSAGPAGAGAVSGSRPLQSQELHGLATPLNRVARLRPTHLRADLLAARADTATYDLSAEPTYAKAIRAPRGFTCARAKFGKGLLVAAEYDGAPVVIAYREPKGSTQVAEVLQCGTGTVLGSVTLPR